MKAFLFLSVTIGSLILCCAVRADLPEYRPPFPGFQPPSEQIEPGMIIPSPNTCVDCREAPLPLPGCTGPFRVGAGIPFQATITIRNNYRFELLGVADPGEIGYIPCNSTHVRQGGSGVHQSQTIENGWSVTVSSSTQTDYSVKISLAKELLKVIGIEGTFGQSFQTGSSTTETRNTTIERRVDINSIGCWFVDCGHIVKDVTAIKHLTIAGLMQVWKCPQPGGGEISIYCSCDVNHIVTGVARAKGTAPMVYASKYPCVSQIHFDEDRSFAPPVSRAACHPLSPCEAAVDPDHDCCGGCQ